MDNLFHSPPSYKNRRSNDRSAYDSITSEQHHALGVPKKRNLCDPSEVAALLLSICCSITGLICCFHRATAANVGQKYQLIIVGLMLSIMDLCTSKLSTTVFLQLETRWASLLQNYDVIVKRSVLGSLLNMRRGSQRWTLLLSASLVFPLLLSVGYKTFVGGTITNQVFASGGEYGLTGPVGLARFSAGSSLMVNATIPLMFNNITKLPSRPQPFGFNMLVLPNKSITVVMLDGPSPSYVNTIRSELEGQQYYIVAADGQVKQFFILLTPHESNRKVKPSKDRFRKEALYFTRQQLHCSGKWKITRSSVDLIDGSCDGGSFDKEFPDGCRTLHLNDASFILADFVGDLLTNKLDEASQIQFTAAISSMLWSRLTAYCGIGAPTNHLSSKDMEMFKYHKQDEAWKTVGVLKRTPLLALVLLAQPIVGLVLLIVRIVYCSAPVSGGFGLISVLAGHGPRKGNLLTGAGLSGEVNEGIQVDFNINGEIFEDSGERVQFELRRVRHSMPQGRKKLKSRVKYH
ncbi:hypothetical protein HG531_005690 [Fusarium graminearum]|nr:hypothetical protein HG531_005690 [Fusarium graminearum]